MKQAPMPTTMANDNELPSPFRGILSWIVRVGRFVVESYLSTCQ